jgi:hypothetical protein
MASGRDFSVHGAEAQAGPRTVRRRRDGESYERARAVSRLQASRDDAREDVPVSARTRCRRSVRSTSLLFGRVSRAAVFSAAPRCMQHRQTKDRPRRRPAATTSSSCSISSRNPSSTRRAMRPLADVPAPDAALVDAGVAAPDLVSSKKKKKKAWEPVLPARPDSGVQNAKPYGARHARRRESCSSVA